MESLIATLTRVCKSVRENNNRSLIVLLLVGIIVFLSSQPIYGQYAGGDGTTGTPFLISNPNHMQAIGAHPEHWGKHFRLISNIDLSPFDGQDGRDPFNRIGTGSSFTGVFDGDNHIISNFYCNITLIQQHNIGLFDNVGAGGQITDLRLEDVNIVSSSNRIAGLVGENRGKITNCQVTGSVSGFSWAAGLIGHNYGAITNCSSTVNVTGEYTSFGGLLGENDALGTITNCYATGSVTSGLGTSYGEGVGGLVGRNVGNITNCHATGDVMAEGDYFYYIGGLVGYNVFGAITRCYATGNVTAGESSVRVGGLVGANDQATITNSFATGNVTGDYGVGGLAGGTDGPISDCYASGVVIGDAVGGLVGLHNAGIISNSYASGSVEGVGADVGGLVGWGSQTVTTSFWDIQSSDQSTSNGGSGKSTAEMKSKDTFIGWDFVEVWGIEDVQTYPFLKLAYPIGDLNYDHITNLLDFVIMARHWLQYIGPG